MQIMRIVPVFMHRTCPRFREKQTTVNVRVPKNVSERNAIRWRSQKGVEVPKPQLK